MATTKKRNDTPDGPKKAPATKSQAPTNPGNPGTPSNEPCVPCQKAALAGCDVNTLELIAISEVAVPVFPKKDDANKQQSNPHQPPPPPPPPPVKKPTDAAEPRTIKASTRLRKKLTDEERKQYPEDIHKHLENFDIILDCTAGFKDGYLKLAKTAGAPNIQNLSAKATFHRAGKCPTGEHPRITANVLSGKAERIDGGSMGSSATIVPWPGGSYIKEQAEVPWPPEGEERRFLADPIAGGRLFESGDFTSIFYLIFAIMQSSQPKLIQVVAEGHGKRTDGQEIRHSLLGLYRIFREDQISIVMATKGPGRLLQKEPAEPGADKQAAKAVEAYATSANSKCKVVEIVDKVERASVRGIINHAPKSVRKGFVKFKKNSWPNSPGTSIQVLINDEQVTLVDVSKWMSYYKLFKDTPANKPKGYEDFDGGPATLGLWLAMLWDLSVTNLQNKIASVLKAIKGGIKFGLWLDLEFSWFEGNIGLKWATKDGKTLPRYRGIVHGWSFVTEITVLNIIFTLKFGAMADFGSIANAWAYVYVGLAFKVGSAFEISFDSDNAGTEKWEITSEPELSIGATGGANLLGGGASAMAEGRVKLTFKMSLEVDFAKNTSKLETSLVLNPIVLEYRAEWHVPIFPDIGGRSNGQWYPWGAARKELWSAKVS